jgi:hypothetical protein
MPLTRPLRARRICIVSSRARLSVRGRMPSRASAYVSASSLGPARSSNCVSASAVRRRARDRQGSVGHPSSPFALWSLPPSPDAETVHGSARLQMRPRRTACRRSCYAVRRAVRQNSFTPSRRDASAGASTRSKACPRGIAPAADASARLHACERSGRAARTLPGGERASSGASSGSRARRTARAASEQGAAALAQRADVQAMRPSRPRARSHPRGKFHAWTARRR